MKKSHCLLHLGTRGWLLIVVLALVGGGVGTQAAQNTPLADWSKTESSPQQKTGLNGTALAFGDVNGDGYEDLIVGSPGYMNRYEQNLNVEVGRVRVYLGSVSGLQNTAYWQSRVNPAGTRTDGETSSAKLGASIAAGDVDGDGVDEFLVADGAQFFPKISLYGNLEQSPAQLEPVWTNGTDFFDPTPVIYNYPQVLLADVNGDGLADVIVGSQSPQNQPPGFVSVFYSKSGVFGLEADWTYPLTALPLNTNPRRYAQRVPMCAADVNGDGVQDLLFGDSVNDTVYAFHGTTNGLAATASYTIVDAFEFYPRTLAKAGDVNGDGKDDVLINWKDVQSFGATAVLLYFGAPQGLNGASGRLIEAPPGMVQQTYWGSSLASAGRFNNDAYDDFMVGSFFGYTDSTTIYVDEVGLYFGSTDAASSGITSNRLLQSVSPPIPPEDFGTALASGRVFGRTRGGSDIVVGAPTIQDGYGTVYAWYGYHPPLPHPPFRIEQITTGTNAVILMWPGLTNYRYSVWHSTNLWEGFATELTNGLLGGSMMTIHTVDVSTVGSHFFKTVVEASAP